MPPIPIYSHSPINAAKADGITPKTAEKGDARELNNPPPPPPPSTTTQNATYPAAQPGAVPALPVPTGSIHHQTPLQPTPTQPLTTRGPPLPQPNAFPVPPSACSPPRATQTSLPPPPKAGVSASTPAVQRPPPQMSIPAPPAAATQGAQRGTAINFVAAPSPLEHPPGYVQDPHASEMNKYQRAAQEALDREDAERRGSSGEGEGGGVWGSVKGAVAAAGGKIAAAEEQVWKRINKDL